MLAKNALSVLVLVSTLSVAGAGLCAPAAGSLSSQDLVYSYDEMFEFDTHNWLSSRAPHLLPHAEAISHWAGFSGVSPKVLLALMEQQSGIVSQPASSAAVMRRPFADLLQETGFNAQLKEAAQSLRDAMYDRADEASSGPIALSSGNPLRVLFTLSGQPEARAQAAADDAFQAAYVRLFGTRRQAVATSARFAATQPRADVPPTNLLQFPYPLNEKWHIGGAHTNSGSGRFPMSSLDMSQGGWWGSNQSGKWVSASAAGTFKRHSSCMAEIVHAGGWSTTYYHLSNIQRATGETVSANDRVANPANSFAQALCNGGMSTGPHQHWSLKSNGSQHHLNGVTVSSYLIKATGNSYDTDCGRFNLSRNGRTYCSGSYTNIGIDAP